MVTARFLIVDDDDIDAKAISRAIQERGLPLEVRRAVDGEEALHMLRGTGGHERIQGPVVVTLDLNMPRMNGLECLHALREDPALHETVVFIVTTSDTPTDREEAYSMNPAGYIVKGTAPGTYEAVADLLAKYTQVVALPERK